MIGDLKYFGFCFRFFRNFILVVCCLVSLWKTTTSTSRVHTILNSIHPTHAAIHVNSFQEKTAPLPVVNYILDNKSNSTNVVTYQRYKTLERFESAMNDVKLKTCISCKTTALSLERKSSGK